MRRWFIPILVLALLALLVAGLLRPRDPAGTPLAGQPAPDFKLQTLVGGQISLSSLRGRAVVLNFWASWCLPCRDEAPLLRQAALEGADRNYVVIGIAIEDRPEDVRKFVDEFGLGFPILLDNDGERAKVRFGVTGVPETFFIDKNGKIVSRLASPLTRSTLEAELARVLKGES